MRLIVSVLLIFSLLPASACFAQTLTFLFPNRAPYNSMENGQPEGILIDLMQAILADAGITPRFEEMPSQRILSEIYQEGSTVCSFGWFKNPERLAKAQFTQPFYRDTPIVLVALASNAKLFKGKETFKDVAADKRLIPGLIDGWSYGSVVDSLLKENSVQPTKVLDRDSQALMLAYGRFTYTLIRQAEVAELIHLSGKQAESFLVLPLPDLKENSNLRYILCGKGVSRDTMRLLDEAIARVCPIQ